MFGRERSLVQRFTGEPFVLLGVNADESPERLRRIQERAQLNWASWWDGPGGEIAAAWGVDRYPAFFVIDSRGVIRWRQFGVPPEGVLERKIEELLQEARKKT
jgi:hypothetical protein